MEWARKEDIRKISEITTVLCADAVACADRMAANFQAVSDACGPLGEASARLCAVSNEALHDRREFAIRDKYNVKQVYARAGMFSGWERRTA